VIPAIDEQHFSSRPLAAAGRSSAGQIAHPASLQIENALSPLASKTGFLVMNREAEKTLKVRLSKMTLASKPTAADPDIRYQNVTRRCASHVSPPFTHALFPHDG
jgi:hypothetical protein